MSARNGKYEGIQGNLTFEWTGSVGGTGDVNVDAQTVRMVGSYRLP
jgi:hypothetical protein